jgi:transaldolase
MDLGSRRENLVAEVMRSLLHQTTLTTPTEFWNDSCEVHSLRRAIADGATGATSNPVIVMSAIEADRARWDEITRGLLRDHPRETESEIAWRLAAEAARQGAELLMPVFEAKRGRAGRLSVQTNPQLYRDAARIVEQGLGFSKIAPNIAIKVPAVAAGIEAIEELTARGVVINATVSFSVAQAVLAAEAVERGLARAPNRDQMTPWITIMAGRIDDHLRDETKEKTIAIELVRHASTAIVRRAYKIFRARGYRAKLLVAAMRSHHHWSEFIGGELVITIPPEWQEKFNASGVEVKPRIDDEVDPEIVSKLSRALPDFVRAYEEKGLRLEELEHFGATRKTLRQFLGAVDKLTLYVRDVMLAAP